MATQAQRFQAGVWRGYLHPQELPSLCVCGGRAVGNLEQVAIQSQHGLAP